jgi:hypothetical protein
MLQAAKKMQETEEETVVILDLQDEEQAEENTINKAKVEVKATESQVFFLKRVIRRVKEKLLEWWDILGEDEYG